ncbi:helix-turn-helix domain-containing protein [Acetobacterium wieringae]|uniref:helix-turn-helix domain-containing protein n=1 Tax=Acetobacterium wieringae TaxID=52694 RepID=UPI0020336D26|nr:helix-turn-helix transcriptional regulator [Acetobacterium wieringae]URN85850.1 helix-turn-helix transcriptional regulator [Acetobacterium wieringae]
MTLQEKLVEEIDKRQVTRAEFAKIVGVDPTVISSVIKHNRSIGNGTVKRLVDAIGKEFEQFYVYKICEICGEKFLPRSNKIRTCSDECARLLKNQITVQWTRTSNGHSIARETDAQRFGRKAKVAKPKVGIAEYNSVAREEFGSYGQRAAAERLARSGTMRESMGLG